MKVSDEIIIKEYKELNSIHKVAKKLDMSSSTVAYRLKKAGVLKKWKKAVKDSSLIRSYKKHQSVRKVAKEFNISHETARYKLKALGVLNKPIEKYSSNDDFFKKNTPESLYWVGFIAADGCVKLKDKKYKQLSVALSYKDHDHVEKFKKAVGFNGPVHKIAVNTGGYKSEITISSDEIFDDLARFNIVPRKSLIYTFPEWLKDHSLVSHFMRGYFDGDGSFYFNKGKKTSQLYFSLRGTKKFLTEYKNILEINCKIKKNINKPRFNEGIYTLEYGGNLAVKSIAKFIYKNSNQHIRLERKYNIARS